MAKSGVVTMVQIIPWITTRTMILEESTRRKIQKKELEESSRSRGNRCDPLTETFSNRNVLIESSQMEPFSNGKIL